MTVHTWRERLGLHADYPPGCMHEAMQAQIDDLQAALENTEKDRDKYYGHLAGILWSEALDNVTVGELREMADRFRADKARLATLENETIERCAKVCEELDPHDHEDTGRNFAEAIRALKKEG